MNVQYRVFMQTKPSPVVKVLGCWSKRNPFINLGLVFTLKPLNQMLPNCFNPHSRLNFELKLDIFIVLSTESGMITLPKLHFISYTILFVLSYCPMFDSPGGWVLICRKHNKVLWGLLERCSIIYCAIIVYDDGDHDC